MKPNYYDSILDNINLRIIDILSKDSSTAFVEIAKQIGISDTTVHLRVRRLIAAHYALLYHERCTRSFPGGCSVSLYYIFQTNAFLFPK